VPDESDDSLLRTKEAAKKLGKAESSLAGERSRGEGCPFIKLGGNVFYRLGDIRDYIKGQRFTSVAQAREARRQQKRAAPQATSGTEVA
jgi:hypothetical protein